MAEFPSIKSRSTDPYTLILMEGQAGKVHRFQFRRSWMKAAAWLGGLLAIAVPLFSWDYVRLRHATVELGQLRVEAAAQREELHEYTDWMGQISERLSQVSALDRKLRVITSLDPADPMPLPGVGGMNGEGMEPGHVSSLPRRQRRERMRTGLRMLEQAAEQQGKRLEELILHLEDQTARLGATPSITPTRGWVTSEFGNRSSPFTGSREFHRGIDIAARPGTPIVAPADGKVRYVGEHRALGRTVIVRHGYGVETFYGHLSEVFVEPGDRIKRGQELASIGSTGRSTGPHLHYQVQINGAPVDPRNYMLD
ncbi:MAG: M23 family metallopeptidase [Myxococcota bacterium]